jgi:hypothetical protein
MTERDLREWTLKSDDTKRAIKKNADSDTFWPLIDPGQNSKQGHATAANIEARRRENVIRIEAIKIIKENFDGDETRKQELVDQIHNHKYSRPALFAKDLTEEQWDRRTKATKKALENFKGKIQNLIKEIKPAQKEDKKESEDIEEIEPQKEEEDGLKDIEEVEPARKEKDEEFKKIKEDNTKILEHLNNIIDKSVYLPGGDGRNNVHNKLLKKFVQKRHTPITDEEYTTEILQEYANEKRLVRIEESEATLDKLVETEDLLKDLIKGLNVEDSMDIKSKMQNLFNETQAKFKRYFEFLHTTDELHIDKERHRLIIKNDVKRDEKLKEINEEILEVWRRTRSAISEMTDERKKKKRERFEEIRQNAPPLLKKFMTHFTYATKRDRNEVQAKESKLTEKQLNAATANMNESLDELPDLYEYMDKIRYREVDDRFIAEMTPLMKGIGRDINKDEETVRVELLKLAEIEGTERRIGRKYILDQISDNPTDSVETFLAKTITDIIKKKDDKKKTSPM